MNPYRKIVERVCDDADCRFVRAIGPFNLSLGLWHGYIIGVGNEIWKDRPPYQHEFQIWFLGSLAVVRFRDSSAESGGSSEEFNLADPDSIQKIIGFIKGFKWIPTVK